MKPNLIRWGALGALLAAVAGIALFIVDVATVGPQVGPQGPEASTFGLPTSYLIVPALIVGAVGMLGGLVGLHARQAMIYGKLGKIGFWAAFMGFAIFLTFLGATSIGDLFPRGSTPPLIRGYYLSLIINLVPLGLGLLAMLVGFVLLGIATLRARVLPRWCGAALIVVPPLLVALRLEVRGIPGGGIAFGLVWLALGYVLWSHRGAETRWRPTRRGILRIVGIFAALALVLPAVYIALYLEQIGPVLGVGAAVVLLTVVVALTRIGYRYEWTGFGEDVRPKTDAQDVRHAKTLWDWLSLLIIPLVLAVGGLLFSFAQDARQQETEEQRAQDAALQAYLGEIGELLLDKKLQPANLDNEARTLARARTLTILERLKQDPREDVGPIGQPSSGPDRKRSVLQFLYESNLISKENVVVDLRGANLRGVNLSGIDLSGAVLSGSILEGAYLVGRGANLSNADLTDANLQEAELQGANLSNADLSGANLHEANLRGANLPDADLIGARLDSATLTSTNLIDADLTDADLTGADLRATPAPPSASSQEPVVTQEQIDQAWGDRTTQLPEYLEYPKWWIPGEEQKAKMQTKMEKSKVFEEITEKTKISQK